MGPIPPLSGTMLAALVAALLNFLGEPVKTLEQTVTRGGASGLDVLQRVRHVSSAIILGKESKHTHLRCRRLCRPSLSVISATVMAFYQLSVPSIILLLQLRALTGRSCLLAKTSSRASLSSSSLSMRWSSSRASGTRSRSLLSTTKIIPWVFWK